ncbi:MAG TPA: response regulator transcription factor [Acidimicrobiia bacterium]|jgi:DNA-binding response OmpR family regulator|nr:response regulator transcription factor [Acidimicrobiia bacterium]
MASVLLIEDDQRIRQSLAASLAEMGHELRSTPNGMSGVREAVESDPDVVVLDLGLPDLPGAEVLKMIRAVSTVPVIIATAQDDESGIVSLLDLGADDYVTKPFSAAHLAARIRAVLRRSNDPAMPQELVVGDLTVDLAAHSASIHGEQLQLTSKEFELLAFLASRPGVMVSKRTLMAEVWRQPYGGADKTVDVHLSWLRRKLGETAADPIYIHTKRGVGVKLVDPTA